VSTEAGRAVASLRPEPGGTLAEVTGMVAAALSDYGEWTRPIAPDDRLDADLGMQSVELAALRTRLADRWGPAADLGPLLATLDLAGLAGLTVAAVAAWVDR
jgi:acyl carrier protein